MLTKKSLLISGAAVVLGVAGTAGANVAFATHDSKNDDLVARIAQEFNLSEEEVQAVFDEYKSDQQEAKVSEYLQKLVDKGKITAEQKTAIETKLGEVRAEIKTEHDELEAWAEAEGIEMSYVFKYNLDDLVKKGEITQEQKTAIEQKRDELRQKHSEVRKDLKQWAKDNKISLKYLMMDKGYYSFGRDFGHGFGFGHDHKRWDHHDKNNR